MVCPDRTGSAQIAHSPASEVACRGRGTGVAAIPGRPVLCFLSPSREEGALSFRPVFIAVVIGTALLVAAFMLNWYRPRFVTDQPTAALIRASGKCAECHLNLQHSVVHE